ncbi:hypothetical protein [Virgibacillus halodenitrificans]|uniref:Helix-turn-helix conjugative transposon-like domain-containing protein n=1 Tax=Virgibacillus halodenitrificans TaxID=1482 RepID=A0ABR7VL20_VIRHA|nr:hypothetical protein [Virgibacillus halodenitrificans]MBD1221522.1 hypothetical protein [Virgibacillus halodenitrificans]
MEEKTCGEIINDFEPKIIKVLSKVSYNDQEDMKQEIKIKILEKVKMLDDLGVPGFLEFINKNE